MNRYPHMAQLIECARTSETLLEKGELELADEERERQEARRFPVRPEAEPAAEVYGVRADQIAALCGVDIATARRWKRGTSRIPVAAKKLLAGDLGALDPAWKGWTMRDGKIISPERWEYSPGEVLSLTLLRAQVAHLEMLRRRVDAMEEQPLPQAATG